MSFVKKINGVLSIQNYIDNKDKLVNIFEENSYTSPSLIGVTEGINIISNLDISDNIEEIQKKINVNIIKEIIELYNKVI